MSIDWNAFITMGGSVLLLFVGAWINRLFAERPKIVTYLAHSSGITVRAQNGQNFVVHVHTIVLKNMGRKPANNLRMGHYTLPAFSVSPDIQYQENDLPGGSKEILFPSVGPKEQITVSYLYYPPTTWREIHSYVKTDEGPAKVLTVYPSVQYPRWILNIIRGLLALGCITTSYIVFLLIRQFMPYVVSLGG
ncbi:MAG: hypothetical protein IT442_00220 [Phycisphaeraceae bacterium]|nr:hypothetical protein [Phycisphaeraceae bacterium]